MDKQALEFNSIANYFLSPGDIYWKNIKGEDVLISKKGEILNFKTLLNLKQTKQDLLINNGVNDLIHRRFVRLYEKISEESNFKIKLLLRKNFNNILMEYYCYSDISQDDLNVLCWKLFCDFDKKVKSTFLIIDSIYFKKAMNITTSVTILAFLLGYYDEIFLKKLYSSTLLNITQLCGKLSSDELIAFLEEIRAKATLQQPDLKIIEKLVDPLNFNQCFLFEKFNGSGKLGINIYEMKEIEVLLIALIHYYKFTNKEYINIISCLISGEFKTENKITSLIESNFETEKT